ncbi:MAG: ParB/RepB/Spo0J family partition protein [Elusimicrobiota bacterium]
MVKKALGRGIDAIISRVNESNLSGSENVTKISLDDIIPNRFQPRQNFDEESIKELAQSIKENGLAQPIIVTKINENKYEIIAGERRYRACKYLGLKEIDAIVKNNINDNKKITIALIENIQREDLNPVEKAMAYAKMLDMGMSQNEIADYCGKSKASVSNTLRLLDLDSEILDGIKNNIITEGHARALMQIPDLEERKKVYQRIIVEKMSVRDVESYSKSFYSSDKKRGKSNSAHKTPETIEMEKFFESKLGTKVEIKPVTETSGKIIISYFSLDDFDKIKNKIS